MAYMVPLVLWAFWIGVYPKPYFEILEKPVAKIVKRIQPDYYRARGLPDPLPGAPPVAQLVRTP
jgi:NADH-quinone oxidoreductase subunit M